MIILSQFLTVVRMTSAPTRTNPSTCHYLRHSFASRAVALGESLPMIAKPRDDPERLVDDIKPSVAEPLTKRVPVSVAVARALLWGRPGDPYAPHTGANIAYLPGRKKGVDEGAAVTDSRGARS